MRIAKRLIERVAIAASLVAIASSANAAPVQVCYKLNPFGDYLKLVRNDVGPGGHRALYGSWIFPGGYTIPVSGAFELEAGSTTVRKVGIVGANNSTSFGDNLICGLSGTPGGAWELNCSGGSSNVNFQNSGTFNQISCFGLAPSLGSSGRAAGSK